MATAHIRPDRFGRYPRLLNDHIQRMMAEVVVGDGRIFPFGMMRTGAGIYLGLTSRGAGWMVGRTDYDYVRDCFPGLDGAAVLCLLDFIHDQVSPGEARLGLYEQCYCAPDGENDEYNES